MAWDVWVSDQYSHRFAEAVLRSVGAYDEVKQAWLAREVAYHGVCK